MKKLLLLLALCPSLSNAQNKVYTGTIVKFNPTALVPIPFSAIQLSVEQQLSEKFSVQLEGGYGIRIDAREDSIFVKPKAFKLNTEFRYHFKKGIANCYVGLNAFYRYERRNTSLLYTPHYDSIGYWDRVVVINNSPGLALVFGVQQKFRSYVFNPYIGVGGLYRNIKNTHRQFDPSSGDENGAIGYHHYFFRDRYMSENTGWWPYCTIGIRLGYAFRKRV